MWGTVYKSRAVKTGIIVCALLLILAVFPLRLVRREWRSALDTPAAALIPRVDDGQSVQFPFEALFDRLECVTVDVTAVEGGRYLSLRVLDEYGNALCERFTALDTQGRPMPLPVHCGIRLEPGREYRVELSGRRSALRVSGATLSYDLPAAKGVSLLLIGIIATGAALMYFLSGVFFARFPAKDTLLTKRAAWGVPLSVLIVAGALFLFVCNFPLKRFGANTADIAFFAAGIVMAALIALYALRRFLAEMALPKPSEARRYLSTVLFALLVQHCADYVNGLYNIHHDVAYESFRCGILLLVLLTFPGGILLHKLMLPAAAVSLAAFTFLTRVPPYTAEDDIAYELLNRREYLKCAVPFIGALVAVAFLLSARELIRGMRAQGKTRFSFPRGLSPYAALTLFTFLGMIFFRYGRDWLIMMALLFFVLYLRLYEGERRAVFLRVASDGVALHFFGTVLYCLLHRAWQYYILTRYSMSFHTVTVTGEYLALVCGFATARLIARMQREQDVPFSKLPARIWKEAVWFGTALSYTLFSITRQAWLAVAVTVLVLLLAGGIRHLHRHLPVLCLSVLLLFVPLFTLQRILPAIRGDFVIIRGIEERWANPQILGEARWDNPNYISVDHFFDEAAFRLTGSGAHVWRAKEDPLNYDEAGNALYGHNGVVLQKPEPAPVQDPVSVSPSPVPKAEESATAPVTEGRLAVWMSFLPELGIEGHAGMYNENTVQMHAHNMYIQAMFEFGLPVGILFSAWIGITIITGLIRVRKDRKKDAALTALGAAVSFAAVGMFDWAFFMCNPATLLFMCGIVPLLYREAEPEKEEIV